jgi:hypothetical protein
MQLPRGIIDLTESSTVPSVNPVGSPEDDAVQSHPPLNQEFPSEVKVQLFV